MQVKQALGQSRRNKVFGALLGWKDSTDGVQEGTQGSRHKHRMIREKLSGLGDSAVSKMLST